MSRYAPEPFHDPQNDDLFEMCTQCQDLVELEDIVVIENQKICKTCVMKGKKEVGNASKTD